MRYLLWGQVLHTPGDLIGAGHQVFKRQSFVWDLTGVKWVVHPRRPSCPQVFPKIPFRGVFHQHIQRACTNTETIQSEKSKPNIKAVILCVCVHWPSCVHAPSKLMMFLCFPIIFIISISEMRSDRSFSVASANENRQHVDEVWFYTSKHLINNVVWS